VKRRVAKLSEDGAIYLLPNIDLKALQGIVSAEVVVDYASRESRAPVNKQLATYLNESLVFSNTSGPFGYFALVFPNVSHVEQIARWVGHLQGVRGVRTLVLQDVILNQRHYETKGKTSGVRPQTHRALVMSKPPRA